MLSSLFKKSETEVQHNVNLKHSEQALQDRVNRMMRHTVKFDWSTAAIPPAVAQSDTISSAMHGKKSA